MSPGASERHRSAWRRAAALPGDRETGAYIVGEQLHAKADAKYNQSVDQARKLRELAEEKAEQKDYDSAIRDIMLSTKEIMKALKHIGLPVPGLSLQE